MTVHILSMRDRAPEGATVIDTTTRSKTWSRGLSPMIVRWRDMKVENVWQYTKVYPQHWDSIKGVPTAEWFEWRNEGARKDWADRYPMGKGAKPICSWWGLNPGHSYDYIEARKQIYVPVYSEAVRFTDAFLNLKMIHQAEGDIWLRDFDGYDHIKMGRTLDEVLNDPGRKMGHAFVLAHLLEGGFRP